MRNSKRLKIARAAAAAVFHSVYPIDANTTAQLQAYFAPHNAMLYKLLGRDLGWGPKKGT